MNSEKLFQNRIRIGWLASGFIGRSASGTAYVARQVVEQFLTRYNDHFEIVMFTKNENESAQVRSDPVLHNATVIQLPKVYGTFMNGSRQFYRYAKNKEKVVDFLIFSVARVYPFFWRFPAKKFICIFHAAGDVTVKADKFVLSKHIYNYINKLQWRSFDSIIAVSEFAKNEIVENYGVAVAAVRVIPPGINSFMSSSPTKPAFINSKKPIIAVMGRWQTYKNVGFACKVLRKLQEDPQVDFHIVLVGRSNVKGRDKVFKEVSLHSSGRLSLIEYLEPSELVWLYQNAQLVVIPSLNEGFGMPSFEAYSVGAKILVHSTTPAAYMLKNELGVYSCDMTNFLDSCNKIRSILEKNDQTNQILRNKYIKNRKLTWVDFGDKYADLILEQSFY